MTYALEAINLTKIFKPGRGLIEFLRHPSGKEVRALDGVSLTVEKGKIFALIGPNAAGKTTLIKVFCSLVIPDSGRCLINGKDISREGNKAKAGVSLIYGEEKSFYWRLTVRENLEFFAALYGFGGKRAKERIDELAEILALGDLNVRYQECSAGIRQRAAVARSLLGKADIIFMDEPFLSLDPGATENLINFIKNILVGRDGKTIFIATHMIEKVESFANRLGVIDKGKLISAGSFDEVKRAFGAGSLDDIFERLSKYHA
ncbi:MAG: ABC transporter ATP-binding protein [Candidatus Omnitrophica bacterium]|nr:ABC transporter ATP-binding protein [Candidatus Omnitrophota bacterium]